MTTPHQQAEYVQWITAVQRRLYAYILTLMPAPERADDILQETNLVLWQKIETFEPGTNFEAWARRIAWYQTKAYIKKHRRRWSELMDGALIDRIAEAAERVAEHDAERRRALRDCLEQLPGEDRDLIGLRYGQARSIGELSAACGRTIGALKQALYRIRGNLRRCVQQHPSEAGT